MQSGLSEAYFMPHFFLYFFKLFISKIYFVLYLILSLILLIKSEIMTPEERQKAISEAFYRISIYAMVTYTHSKDGEHRLQYMLNLINEIPVVYDVEYHNYNHRYFKDILEEAIKDNKEFIKFIKTLI